MVNDFIKGAAAALRGSGLPVYVDEMPMGFKRPCYGLKCVSTEVWPALSGYFRQEIKLCTEIYMPYDYDKADGTPDKGRSFRYGDAEVFAYEALRLIKAGDRLYTAKSITAERKSQTTAGDIPSSVEGVGGLVLIYAVYSRFIKKAAACDSGIMEELFENYYIDG